MIHFWLSVLLFALAAASSFFAFLRAHEGSTYYLSDREAHAVHFVMNGTMAAMFAPFSSLMTERVIFWTLALTALVLLIRLVAAFIRMNRHKASGATYHLLATLAMIYAMTLMPLAGSSKSHEMAGHTATAVDLPWPALVLGLVFVLDAVLTVALVTLRPTSLLQGAANAEVSEVSPQAIAHLRKSAIPHVIMDLGMAMMLL